MKPEPAPIVLFTYNRIWHTQQTVKALQKNELAEQSKLIIYSDGSKDAADWKGVQKVRNYLKSIDGFKSIRIVEQSSNRGLATSIIEGVTDVVNKYGKVIVLEDDIVTSPFFLKYMNDALKYYYNEEQVMHISGYMFPVNSAGLKQTFFFRSTSCWGWATWKRAWDYFEKNTDKLYCQFSKNDIHVFNLDGYHNFWRQVVDNKKKKINTWAIFWYASVFKQQGLSLHPSVSMVKNIGHDRSGAHCRISDMFDGPLADAPVIYFESNITESRLALKRMQQFYKKTIRNLFPRFFATVKSITRLTQVS
ncbi:MAG: glycosyltransferase [Desulfobacterales bacterium]|nr:glycosyltransferase [Desulfobacterales bacterium]